MRPGFLERFVLNCPFCRFNDPAVSCHISQVPAVSVAGLAGAAAIRSLWGPVALEPPPAGIGCVLCPGASWKSVFLSRPLSPFHHLRAASLCLAAASTPRCQPLYEKCPYTRNIQAQRLPSFFL